MYAYYNENYMQFKNETNRARHLMMTMTMATSNTFKPQQQQPHTYPTDRLEDLDDSRLSTCSDDDASSKMQDHFHSMFESSDRTQVGSCVLKDTDVVPCATSTMSIHD